MKQVLLIVGLALGLSAQDPLLNTMGVMVNTNASFGFVSVSLKNVTFPPTSVIASAASGDVDLYTVPAGRRAFCSTNVITTNVSGGAIVVYGELKSGGVYYGFGPGVSVADTANGTATSVGNGSPNSVFLSGESISLNMTATGLSVWWPCVEFDNSSALNRTVVITPAAGAQTIFTSVGASRLLGVYFSNNSGNTRTYSINVVPSGSSVATNNRVVNAATLTAANRLIFQTTTLQQNLANGDFINFNDDANTATQGVWVSYVQF